MDSRMMWAMMIGCCLAIPLAPIIGGASLGGLAGASPWLIGTGVVLAVAMVNTHREFENGRAPLSSRTAEACCGPGTRQQAGVEQCPDRSTT
jgi:hypothetical protein